jgi:hypothetical protein
MSSVRRLNMEHAVIVSIPLTDGDLGSSHDDKLVDKLEHTIREALDDGYAGSWDGHEFGGGCAQIFCYGADGDLLFDALAGPLLAAVLPPGSCATKRYGLPGAPCVVIGLTGGEA